MGRALPEGPLADEAAHLTAFLRFFRDTAVDKCRSLPPAELTAPRVPSGWTPLALLLHLTSMERRWVVWGFLGEPVADPYVDTGGEPDGVWRVPERWGMDDVVGRLMETAQRTDALLAATDLGRAAALGGRFAADPPDLRWIAFHVLQEYARHVGQLDVAVELAGGHLGE